MVSYFAFGPENFSSTAVEGSRTFYMIFSYVVFIGLIASGFGAVTLAIFYVYAVKRIIKGESLSHDEAA